MTSQLQAVPAVRQAPGGGDIQCASKIHWIYRDQPTDGGWGEARAGSPLGPGAGLHWQAVTQHSGKNPAQLSCIIHGSGLGGLVTTPDYSRALGEI